jgi:hypothetical protein
LAGAGANMLSSSFSSGDRAVAGCDRAFGVVIWEFELDDNGVCREFVDEEDV